MFLQYYLLLTLGCGCRSPRNLSKVQIKIGMEGCAVRVRSSVMLRLHYKEDQVYNSQNITTSVSLQVSMEYPGICVSPHTPSDVAGLHFPFHVLSDESMFFPTCSWSDLRSGPTTEEEINSVPHPFPDGPSLQEWHTAKTQMCPQHSRTSHVVHFPTSVFVLFPLP